MPDPDIPPVVLGDDYISKIKAGMPLSPNNYREVLKQLGLDSKVIEDIISVPDMTTAIKTIYDKAGAGHAKRIAFWLLWKTGETYEDGGPGKPAPVAQGI